MTSQIPIQSKKHRTLYNLLAVSSLTFAFLWLPSPDLFDDACAFLTVSFIIAILMPSSTDLRKDPLIRLGMLFFIFLAVSIIWHRFTLPEAFHTGNARKLLNIFSFIPIAYAISRSHLLTPWRLLTVAFSGLLVYLAFNFDAAEWARAWQGHRVDFGIHNAQHTGIVFATCAMAFSAFTGRFYQWTKKLSFPLAAACLLAWSGFLLLSFWGVFVSQTRAVWLGLAVASLALPFFIGLAYILCKHVSFSLRKPFLGMLAFIAIFSVTAYSFNLPELVNKRLSAENVSWESLRLAAAHETEHLTSIGVRVASWSAATEWITEKPFMGWGGRGPKRLIQQSEYFSAEFKAQFGHLHNSYLETLIRIGVLGASFIVALTLLLGRASIKSYKQGSTPTDVFVFSWLFFVFWLTVNIFESYIVYPSGIYLPAVVVALFYSFCLKKEQSTQVSEQQSNQLSSGIK